MSFSSHKRNIDNYLAEFDKDVKFIYGGAAIESIEERKKTHISNRDFNCNSTWIISESITTIPIENKNVNNKDTELEKYKIFVSKVEQYLIDKLGQKYDIVCRNDRNDDGNMAQRGGAGITPILKFGDSVKIYIFYKLNKSNKPKL